MTENFTSYCDIAEHLDNDPKRFAGHDEGMQTIGIILLSVAAAIIYGIVHDQITARICVSDIRD